MLPSPDHVLSQPTTVKPSDTSTKPSEAVEAALLAVAIYHNRLSAAQCCKLAGASIAYFARVNSLNDKERGQLSTGEVSLTDFNGKHTNGHVNGKNGHSDESLIEHMRRSTDAELATAVKAYGLNEFFDTAICPILKGTE
jgi:hypothetical protein